MPMTQKGTRASLLGRGWKQRQGIGTGAAAYAPIDLSAAKIKRSAVVTKIVELPASAVAVDRLSALVGVDDAGHKASLVTAMTGTNNDLLFRARKPGVAGNSIRITLIDPPGNNVAISAAVAANGLDIDVTLGTDGASAITSTAAQVIAAINANYAANGLVEVSNAVGNDGTGVVTALAQTALAGGAATPLGSVVLNVATTGNQVVVDWLERA